MEEDSEIIKETKCSNCSHVPEDETPYCSECGEEDPWITVDKYEFDEDDLPIVFPYVVYEHDGGMWYNFTDHYFDTKQISEKEVSGLPEGFPRMKKTSFTVWYFINEELNIKGPYMTKERAEGDAF